VLIAYLIVSVAFLTLAMPFLVAAIPPLTDFPNHLARYWLIAGGVRDPVLARFYRIDWANAVTNVGVDRAVRLAAPLISGLAFGHLAAVAAAILPPLGMLALNQSVCGRITPWQALFPFAAWSTTFLMGFINFQTSLGLALVFVAFDPLARSWMPRWTVIMRAPLGVILIVDHPFGLLLYGVLLAGLRMGPSPVLPVNWPTLRPRLIAAALEAAWCLIPVIVVLAIGHHALPGAQPPPQDVARPIRYNAFPAKLATLLSPLASYNVFQELALAFGLGAIFVWLTRRRAFTTHGGLMTAAAGLAVLAVISPSHAGGASWVDRRFPIMALFAALAALQLRDDLSEQFQVSVGVAALCISAGQAGWVGWNWTAMERDMDAARAVMAHLPAGARILPLQHDPTLSIKWHAPAGRYMFAVGDPTFRHFDALAVPFEHAFSPKLFAAKGIQPLVVLPPWDAIVEHTGGDLASVSALSRPPLPGEPSYIAGWRRNFDYVLILNADIPDQSGPFRPPPELTPVAKTRFAELWRVAPPAAAPTPSRGATELGPSPSRQSAAASTAKKAGNHQSM
jgi:hypothetical protein